MGLPALQGNFLPHGRWACTPADVEAAFVTGHGPERAAIWQDWLTTLAVLKSLVGTVPAAWLSGSFLSAKPVPGDIDSVFLVDAADLRSAHLALSPQEWSLVNTLAGGGGAKATLGLMALGEIPQGRSSNFLTLGGCHCSGRRVPVAA